MARLDAQAVRQSVRRLTKKYNLTPLARRQLRVFFEIIIGELTPHSDQTVTAEAVERFMLRIADRTNLKSGRYTRAGQTLPATNAITASDLLHAWQNLREFRGDRSIMPDQFDESQVQIAFILDKD